MLSLYFFIKFSKGESETNKNGESPEDKSKLAVKRKAIEKGKSVANLMKPGEVGDIRLLDKDPPIKINYLIDKG